MLIPGKAAPFSPRPHRPQPALRVVCCLWPTLSTKSPSKPIHLSSEATHG